MSNQGLGQDFKNALCQKGLFTLHVIEDGLGGKYLVITFIKSKLTTPTTTNKSGRQSNILLVTPCLKV